jgi:hypothetical protein
MPADFRSARTRAGRPALTFPEARTETSVRLYRATAFPDYSKYAGDLIEGGPFSPTLARVSGTLAFLPATCARID